MGSPRALQALIDSYQDFNIGELQQNFYQDKTIELLKRPVQRYSYALARAALNVFAHHHFADPLNALAFDCDGFAHNVRNYVTQVWPYYLEEAQTSLRSASIHLLHDIEFCDWGPGGSYRFGGWHRMDFREFKTDVLIQVSNGKARLGAFEGLCFLHNDQNSNYRTPAVQNDFCYQLGSLHLQIITDEILESLGITPESAISAIKWQMR